MGVDLLLLDSEASATSTRHIFFATGCSIFPSLRLPPSLPSLDREGTENDIPIVKFALANSYLMSHLGGVLFFVEPPGVEFEPGSAPNWEVCERVESEFWVDAFEWSEV